MQVIKIDSSCFQTNLNLSKPNAHVCSLVPHAQDYVRFYYMLKGQRSMVSCLIPSIEELLPQVETFEGNVLNTLKNHINVLLNAKFGNFYQIANEVIIEIYSNLLKANVSSEISKIVLKALKATLAITRNLSKFQIDKKFISRLFSNMVSGSDEDKVQQSSQKVNFTNQDFIICRICDKRVRSECFEEHTESCIKAYQNETRINAINNDLLDILKFLITNYLSGPWPGTKNTSISLSFPIFHLCFLLNRVCDINPRDADASDELQTLFVSFDYFSSCTLPNEVMIEISRIKKKVNEKRCISNAVRENIEFLSNTQINSDDTPSFATPTTISNFQLIKRISSGAFARVFLAKKKSTGDIYAIKVQPN